MPRKSAFKCYFGCIPIKGRVHSFPPSEYPYSDKFLQWKMVLSEADRAKGDKYIRYNIHLCDHHFEDFYKTCTGRLTKNAVPTLNFASTSTSFSVEPVKTSHNAQATSDQDPIEIEDVADDNLSFYSDDRAATPILESDDEDALLHVGFQCNACNGEIKGFRYTCVQCSDLDLCSACELNGTHSQHYMLRVPKPKPYMETQIVLERIRRHLMKKLDPLADDLDPGDDISVKLEIMSEIDEDEELGKDMDIEETGDLNMSDQDELLIIKSVENPAETSVRKQQESNVTNESTEATNRTKANSNRTGTVPSTAKRKKFDPLTDIMEMQDDWPAKRNFVPELNEFCHNVTTVYLKNSNLLESDQCKMKIQKSLTQDVKI